jgi:hypothetical protein
MERSEIIKELKAFFKVSELVCPHTLKKWGEDSWQFLDTAYLADLLVVRRDILKAPMTANTSKNTQRGLRCNRCNMVRMKTSVYLSAHVLGKAGDFVVSGMTASQAIKKIAENADLLPYPLRLELDVEWLHMDVRSNDKSKAKVTYFKG